MDERIYTMQGDEVTPLTADAFQTEDALQELIAAHPELLAWEQMRPGEPMRWLLIGREIGIAEELGTGDRWAVDLLFIDQDAVPTLVEVKRGANPQVRREVVGQMLEYAANASRTWTVDKLRKAFENSDRPNALGDLLDEGETDDGFWEQVATNLAARRLRLLFVADDVPDELTRIVEFLNGVTASHLEVLAVEIKKYDGETGLRTLVPRVVGRTAKAVRGGPQVEYLNRQSFLGAFTDQASRSAAERLVDVALEHGRVEWGRTGVHLWQWLGSPWRNWVTVAWLHPPGVAGWRGRRDFTFGYSNMGSGDPPPHIEEILDRWFSEFYNDEFAKDVSGRWGAGWQVSPDDAAGHLDVLAERLEDVLKHLSAVEPS